MAGHLKDPIGRKKPVSVLYSDMIPDLQTIGEITDFFHENGYVIMRNELSHSLLRNMSKSVEEELIPYKGQLLHAPKYSKGRNKIVDGTLTNALGTIQSITSKKLSGFVDNFMRVATYPSVAYALNEITQSKLAVGQTFYYEKNYPQGTRMHEDGYFVGHKYPLITTWTALEMITCGAGPMYLFPGTNKLHSPRNKGKYAFSSENFTVPKTDPQYEEKKEAHYSGLRNYFEELERIVKEGDFECVVPRLSRGDVLIFDNATFHGTFAPTTESTRKSVICHWVPLDIAQKGKTTQFRDKTVILNPRDLY